MEADAELAVKRLFAEEWLRQPDNAFAAAMEVSAGDMSLAFKISSAWVHDPEVKRLKAELIAEKGEDAFLPSKASMLQDILRRARTTPRDEDYVKLMRLAADMRGHIEKPGVTINNNVTTNKVMQIPMFINGHGEALNMDEWEKKLIQQQDTLTERQ